MNKAKKSGKFLCLLVTLAMLIGVFSVGLTPSAAASVTLKPVSYEKMANGGWFVPDNGMVALSQIDSTHVQELTEGTYYYMFEPAGTYNGMSSSTVAIITVDANGNVTVKDGNFQYQSWDKAPVTEASTHNAIVYKDGTSICLQWGGEAPPQVDDPGDPVLRRVAITVKSSLELDHMGYGNSLTAGTKDADPTLHTVHPAGTVYLKPGDDYLFYMVKGKAGNWYFNTYDDCIRIKVDEHGCVTSSGAGFDWNGVANKGTLNYTMEPSIGGVMIDYKANTKPQTITTSQMQGVIDDGGVYGPGVPDNVLEEWAQIGHDVPTKVDGSARQTFSVNSVKNILSAFGAKPARTASKIEFAPATLEYYKEQKQLNDQYMKHDTYQYSEYFLHDFYCQGIWDTMPANYGWMQDEYTTPGKIIMKKVPEINGLVHGVAAGGQNPYILCDYIERMAATADKPAVAGTAGEGWYKGYDEVAETPYLWNPNEGIFLSYENEQSLQARTKYIEKKGLGGVIIWEISGENTAYYNMTRILKEDLKDKGKNVVAYFVNWAVYNKYHQQQTPDFIPWDKLTHINYSFYQIGGYSNETLQENPANTLQTVDRWADDYTGGDWADNAPNMLLKFEDLKKEFPDVKVMVSVGGWTRGDGFGTMVETQANRTTFINSIIEFMDKYTFFDGVDLDWEYPGAAREPDYDDPNDQGVTMSSNDYKNYADFVSELRAALDSKYKASGRNLISACCPGDPRKMDRQDIVRLASDLTFVNMMTYDYHGAFDPTIGYNSPLYSHPETPDEWSTDATVRYLEGKGIDLSKVNIGAAYYSRGWAGVKADKYGNPAPLADPTPIFPTGESLKVTPAESEIAVGETVQLTASRTVTTWASSDTSVATVNANGVVKGVSKGVVTIVATAADGAKATAKVTVTSSGTDTKDLVLTMKLATPYVVKDGVRINSVLNPQGCLPMPLLVTGGTVLPMRFVCETLGFEVGYDDATGNSSVIDRATNTTVTLFTGTNRMDVNRNGVTTTVQATAPTILIKNTTHVAVRTLLEQLGYKVAWYESNGGGYIIVSTADQSANYASLVSAFERA